MTRAFVQVLTQLLTSEDPSDRVVAARDIAAAETRDARAALQEGTQVEADARVLMQIDESMRGGPR
jgi:hypothetical protein